MTRKKILQLFDLYRQIQEKLRTADKEPAEQEAFYILEEILGISRQDLVLDKKRNIDDSDLQRIEGVLFQRITHKPLSKIFGKKEFWGMSFDVNEHTLDPRPDSEILVESALRYFPDRQSPLNILDIGTGSGCLLIALLSEYKNSRGMGIDISNDALNVARKNAARLLPHRDLSFKHCGWQDLKAGQTYDLIISNPPYISYEEIEDLDAEVRHHDPHTALFADENGLKAYRELAGIIPSLLKEGGKVILEIGYRQADAVTTLFTAQKLNRLGLYQDHGRRDRCLVFDFYQKD